MRKILDCRRTFIALTAIGALTFLGYTQNMDVAASLAAVAIGLAGSNAYEKRSAGESK